MTDKNAAVKALIKAQSEMGKALKDTKNPFFKSKYADLSSVMGAVMPALNENGFAMIQQDGMDDRGVFVDTVFLHESGEKFTSRIYLTIGKPDMQGYGSAQTYARRYGLMGLAGIAPEDDDGNKAATSPKQSNPSSAGMADARNDAVLDSLPKDASPRDKAVAFSEAIIADITKAKTPKGVNNAWSKWSKHINALQDKHDDLYASVFDAWVAGGGEEAGNE